MWVYETGLTVLRIVTGLLIATLHGWHKVVQWCQYLAAGKEWPLLQETSQLGFALPGVFAVAAALSQFAGGGLPAIGGSVSPLGG